MSKKLTRRHNVWPNYGQARSLPHGFSCTVQTIVDEWMLSTRFLRLSPNTKRVYASLLASWGKIKLPDGKVIFDLRVHKLDYKMVDHFVNLMHFRGLAPSSMRSYCHVMSGVWKYAARMGRVAYNPWADVGIECDNERDVTWSQEEIEKAMQKAGELGFNTLVLYILFMYETGQRPWVDLRNLTWENINDDADGTRWLDYISSKTGVHIRIPLPDRLVSCLEERTRASSWIFAEASGDRRSQQTLFNQFNRVKREASLSYTLQLRDIRRTAVVECIEGGATRDELRAVFGWKKDSSVHRYARIRGKTAQNALIKRDANKLIREGARIRALPPPNEEHSQAD